ncbi:hypothetical protein VBSAUSMH15_57 [Staphylococcus phage vB_SauS_Mh15]|nr:hypothetical protein VBSAUSMH15_57 [Staphylococcus phage vB_SauS_Mh15]
MLALTPAEWRDWLIGGQDRYLEIREPGSYARVQKARLEEEKRRRELFKEGTRKFLESKGG